MKKLFLDDIREPKDCLSYMKYNLDDYREEGWDIVRNFDEFKKYIENCGPNNLPSLISFDHDLADEHYTPEIFWNDYTLSKKHQESKVYKEKTGDDCAEFLVKYIVKHGIEKEYIPDFLIHSANPVGRDKIAGTLRLLESSRFIQFIKTEIFYEEKLNEGTTIDRCGYIPGIRTPINIKGYDPIPNYITPATITPLSGYEIESSDKYSSPLNDSLPDPFDYVEHKKGREETRVNTTNPFNPPGYDDIEEEVKEETKKKLRINKPSKKELIAALVILGLLSAIFITAFF